MTWNMLDKEKKVVTKADFKRSGQMQFDQGLKLLIYGPPETLKTGFCLSSPPPVFVVDTEMGADPVTRHFPGKEINIFDINEVLFDPTKPEPEPMAALDAFDQIVFALKDVTKGTICIDSGTDLYEWLKFWMEATATRRYKATGDVMRTEWARVRQRWRQTMLKFMTKTKTGMNFIMTAHTQDVYAGGSPTGQLRPRVQRGSDHMFDLIIRTWKTYGEGGVLMYMSTIEKCRWAKSFNKTIQDVTWDKMINLINTELKVKIGQKSVPAST